MPRGPFQPAPDTPALPSIFLYVWSGVDNPGSECRDAVVVVDATPESETFGRVINVATTPFHGSEPHHVGLVANATVLATGGIQVHCRAGGAPPGWLPPAGGAQRWSAGAHRALPQPCPPPLPVPTAQSYLRNLPDIFLFNVTNPRAPQYFKSIDPPLVRRPGGRGGRLGVLSWRGLLRLPARAGLRPLLPPHAPPCIAVRRHRLLHRSARRRLLRLADGKPLRRLPRPHRTHRPRCASADSRPAAPTAAAKPAPLPASAGDE